MKKTFFLLTLLFFFVACEKDFEIKDQIEVESHPEKEYVVSKPLHFETVESLRSSMWDNGSQNVTKTPSYFVSFAETVMLEPGYEDRPNAILSEQFGFILNSEGEVEFANYLLKVTDFGILFSPIHKRDELLKLAEDDDLLSYCQSQVVCADINPQELFYKVDQHSDIYLYDTFGLLAPTNNSNRSKVDTKSIAPNLVSYLMGGNLFTFTVPAAGDQKVLFISDNKYCNDTKVFQQSYGVASDGGLKTKTMKKNGLGIWNKISNPIEGGIIGFSLFEYGTFNAISSSTPDINKVKYGGKTKYVYTINARGTGGAQGNVGRNIVGLVNQGNALAQANGLSVSIDAVRCVINDTNAVTVFLDDVDSGTYDKIDKNWPVPLSGDTVVSQSYLGVIPVPNYASYYTIGFLSYGQSTRDWETVGSKVLYNYWFGL